MTSAGFKRDEFDSLLGVRDCGCATAWLSLKGATKKEIREFCESMADTGREVRWVALEDVRGQLFRCEHGGVGEHA